MPSYNNIEIIGHVGQEPEMRFIPNDTPVVNFSVAVNRRYTNAAGEKKEDTEWFSVVVWRKLAEIVNQYCRKGMLVFVSGYIHLYRWENEKGESRSRLQLNANSVLFLDRKSTDKGYDEVPELSGEDEAEYLEEDDIPF